MKTKIRVEHLKSFDGWSTEVDSHWQVADTFSVKEGRDEREIVYAVLTQVEEEES